MEANKLLFHETKLKGAYLIELERLEDERGFFARAWCQKEFKEHGLNSQLVQCNLSYNRKKGSFRGMHYQIAPYQEAKLVRCSRGAIYDIIADLRCESPTFKEYFAVTLSAENREMLYVPERFAHGFITLQDETEIFYQMSEFYSADCARGFRWNDPEFGIKLPIKIAVISDRDLNYPDFG